MSRFLYEHSVSHKGFLIIPFVLTMIEDQVVFSYRLLADVGQTSELHRADNPADLCANSMLDIVAIAQTHLNDYIRQGRDVSHYAVDHFKGRYTYRHNLIVVAEESNKYFYDHYPPQALQNIAAPRLFESELECIQWVKQGLDQRHHQPKQGSSPGDEPSLLK